MFQSLHIVCPRCDSANRLPTECLGSDLKCGKCRAPLFSGHPPVLDAARFERQGRRLGRGQHRGLGTAVSRSILANESWYRDMVASPFDADQLLEGMGLIGIRCRGHCNKSKSSLDPTS